ncbi:MAG: glycosyltransferase family A protein [Actinobacteria bacterium]|nr:glycosyltransferase family A protein [Actinomycetota bacterium]
MTETVSVVVTTKNVERTLEACLDSIAAQTFQPLEIIVVDNFSVDATREIARRWTDKLLVAGPERSVQRNTGFEAAEGNWVMWVDADMVLRPDVLEACLAAVHESGARAVSVPETTVGQGYWTRVRALERHCYSDQPALFNPRFLERGLLEELGGFDSSMAGPEDADLRHRLAAASVPCGVAKAWIDHDEGRLTLRGVWGKRVYYGTSIPAFTQSNPSGLADQARDTMAAYWSHRGDLVRRPDLAAGMVVLRGMESVAYLRGAWEGRRERHGS